MIECDILMAAYRVALNVTCFSYISHIYVLLLLSRMCISQLYFYILLSLLYIHNNNICTESQVGCIICIPLMIRLVCLSLASKCRKRKGKLVMK